MKNVSYTKLFGYCWEPNIVCQKAINIPSWHFYSLTCFQIIFNKIIGRQLVIQVTRDAFCHIGAYTDYISIASTFTGRKPCFSKIRSDIRKQNICFAKSRHSTLKRCCRTSNSSKSRSHVICGNIAAFFNFRSWLFLINNRRNFSYTHSKTFLNKV